MLLLIKLNLFYKNKLSPKYKKFKTQYDLTCVDKSYHLLKESVLGGGLHQYNKIQKNGLPPWVCVCVEGGGESNPPALENYKRSVQRSVI